MMITLERLPDVEWNYRPTDLFERFFEMFPADLIGPDVFGDWVPPADVAETEDNYLLTLEVPGIDIKTMDISYINGVLNVCGEKQKDIELGENCHCAERYAGHFERRFAIPGKVDPNRIDATYKDGIVKITLPKRETEKPKRIEIH